MYDAFSADYDRFVNWESRLASELPFLIQLLDPRSRVLDAACGGRVPARGHHVTTDRRSDSTVCSTSSAAGRGSPTRS